MSALVWLVIGGLLLTVGDIIFKLWIVQHRAFFYLSGLGVYIAGLLCLVQSFKTQHMAVASAIFVIVNIVTLAAVSWVYFGEKLTTQQFAGIGLAMGAILLLR